MAVRVLLVEDDDRVRAVLGLALEDEGYEVAQTASAEEALGSFAEVDPAIASRPLSTATTRGYKSHASAGTRSGQRSVARR